jgi:hypothetical protein
MTGNGTSRILEVGVGRSNMAVGAVRAARDLEIELRPSV